MKTTCKLLWAVFFICTAAHSQAQNHASTDTVPLSPSLRQVCQLRPVMYINKADSGKNAVVLGYGFSTAEVKKVYPALILKIPARAARDKKTQFSTANEMEMSRLIPVLVKSIQEQEAEILVLRARVEELENRNWGKLGL